MALLEQEFNINDLPENTGGDFTPLPTGEYSATIKHAEIKNTQDGTGQYISLRLDVTGPTHMGRIIFSNLNIRNKSEKAQAIGLGQLREIMKAIGLDNLKDSDQLIGASLVIKLAIKEARTDEKTGKTYEAGNEVKSYKAVGSAAFVHGSSPSPSPSASAPKVKMPWDKS